MRAGGQRLWWVAQIRPGRDRYPGRDRDEHRFVVGGPDHAIGRHHDEPLPAPTTSTTTAAPATTTTVVSADELAVRAAWKGWLTAGEACTLDARNCDRATLANYMAGTALSNSLKATDALLAKGWRGRTGPGGIDDRYRIESVTITRDNAIVQYCQYDEGVLYDPGAGPGGSDVIINDAVASRRSRAVFTRPDGIWKVTGTDGDHQEEGRALWDACVAG